MHNTAVPTKSRFTAPTPERTGEVLRANPRFAYLTCAVTLLNIPIHVYWAMGGAVALPGGEGVAALPEAAVANWVVSVVLLLGAAAMIPMAGAWRRAAPGTPLRGGTRIPPFLFLLPTWVGSVVCISHAAFGFSTKALYTLGFSSANFPELPGHVWTEAAMDEAVLLDLAIYEPWFLLEGVLLALAGRQFVRFAGNRRRWTVSVWIGAAAITLFGVGLALADMRVAVS